MSALFVTSTGTDTGKTLVACAILHQAYRSGLTVHAVKPLASGMSVPGRVSDAARLLRAMGKPQHPSAAQAICPWQFGAPLSPHLAARLEGRQVDWSRVVRFCMDSIKENQITLIEGAGGIMSPLDEAHTNLDLALSLNIPLVLVAGSYLGGVSHLLTALEVIDKYRLSLAGIVISESEVSGISQPDMLELLARYVPETLPIFWIGRLADDIDNYKSVPSLEPLWISIRQSF